MSINVWDCPFCKHQENPGFSVYCPSCGMPRGVEEFQQVQPIINSKDLNSSDDHESNIVSASEKDLTNFNHTLKATPETPVEKTVSPDEHDLDIVSSSDTSSINLNHAIEEPKETSGIHTSSSGEQDLDIISTSNIDSANFNAPSEPDETFVEKAVPSYEQSSDIISVPVTDSANFNHPIGSVETSVQKAVSSDDHQSNIVSASEKDLTNFNRTLKATPETSVEKTVSPDEHDLDIASSSDMGEIPVKKNVPVKEQSSNILFNSNQDSDHFRDLPLSNEMLDTFTPSEKTRTIGSDIPKILGDSHSDTFDPFHLDSFLIPDEKSSSFATNQISEKRPTEVNPYSNTLLSSEPRSNFESKRIRHAAHPHRQQRGYPFYIIIALIVILGVFIVRSDMQQILQVFNGSLFESKLFHISDSIRALASAKYSVTGHEWSRAGTIVSNKSIKTEGWQLPPGTELIRRSDVVDHYEKVLDHYEMKEINVRKQIGNVKVLKGRRQLNNGSYEDIYETRPAYLNQSETAKVPIYKNQPIYKTKYVYVIRSTIKRTFNIGAPDKNPYWPKMDLGSNRTDTREEYFLWVKDKNGQTLKASTSLNVWQQINSGDSIKLQKTDNELKTVE